MRRFAAGIFALVVGVPALACAEEIVHLRDGSIVRGRLVQGPDSTHVLLETAHGTLTLGTEDIVAIDAPRGSSEPAAPAIEIAEPTPEPVEEPPLPPSRPREPEPFTRNLFAIEGYLGPHFFFGRGWRPAYGGTGLASIGVGLGVRTGLMRQNDMRVDLAGDVFFATGGNDCSEALAPCTTITASTAWAAAGPRLTIGHELFAFIGANGGLSSSSVTTDRANGPDGDGRATYFSAYVGTGVAISHVYLMAQVRGATAETKIAGIDFEMGGISLLATSGISF